jgi:hypothetical protein
MHLIWPIGNAADSGMGKDLGNYCVLANAHAAKHLHGAICLPAEPYFGATILTMLM